MRILSTSSSTSSALAAHANGKISARVPAHFRSVPSPPFAAANIPTSIARAAGVVIAAISHAYALYKFSFLRVSTILGVVVVVSPLVSRLVSRASSRVHSLAHRAAASRDDAPHVASTASSHASPRVSARVPARARANSS